jgi:pimeloyl-ACP methyl ester carboxylesterase
MPQQRLASPPISVRTTEGAGPTIVLIHGNSSSSRAFACQLDGPLGRRFRVIAIDLPGHGDSAWADDPDTTYTLPGYARAVVETARQLDASNAVFVGWSLGGHVLLEAIPQLVDAAGFCIIGAPPIASAADLPSALAPDPALAAAFRAESSEEELMAWLRLFLRPGTEVPPTLIEDYHRSDPRARTALAASAARNELADEARIVARLTRPLAAFHGRHDGIAQRAFLDRAVMPTLWRGAVTEFAESGHSPHSEVPDEFDRQLAAFVAECTGVP